MKCASTALLCLFASRISAQSLGLLEAPLRIPVQGATSVTVGDFNGDGHLDLATAATDSHATVFLRDGQSGGSFRRTWREHLGNQSLFIAAGRFGGDTDDLVVADPQSWAYFLRSRGDGTFEPVVQLRQAPGSRWVAPADLDEDGALDFAVSSFSRQIVVVFRGTGDGRFNFPAVIPVPILNMHPMSAIDLEGDGHLDLLTSAETSPDITPLRGDGKGAFTRGGGFPELGGARYLAQGDLNLDGLEDLAVSQRRVGLSRGDGTFRRILDGDFSNGTTTPLLGDFDGDSFIDAAFTKWRGQGSFTFDFLVYRGKGDGSLYEAVEVPLASGFPFHGVTADLDGDARAEVLLADSDENNVLIFSGSSLTPYLVTGRKLSGAGARQVAVIPGEVPLIFLPRREKEEGAVFRAPVPQAGIEQPSSTFPLPFVFQETLSHDLDRDGLTDLVGLGRNPGRVGAAFPAPGGPRAESWSLDPGVEPVGLAPAVLARGGPPAFFLLGAVPPRVLAFELVSEQGWRQVGEPWTAPPEPSALAAADLDGDGSDDVLVGGAGSLVLGKGLGGGRLAPPRTVLANPAKRYSGALLLDWDGDGRRDVLVLEEALEDVGLVEEVGPPWGLGPGFLSDRLLLLLGGPEGELGTPELLAEARAVTAIVPADVDLDGALDVVLSTYHGFVHIILSSRGAVVEQQFQGLDHARGAAVADVTGDGIPDVTLAAEEGAVVLAGRSLPVPHSTFRRGDADRNGAVELSDPIALLGRLFLGGPIQLCETAADSDDDGSLKLTDAIYTLRWLFLGGDPPPAPGAVACGPDPTPDLLEPCEGSCE